MDLFKIQQRLGLLFSSFCFVVTVFDILNVLETTSLGWLAVFNPAALTVFVVGVVFLVSSRINHPFWRFLQAALLFAQSAPSILATGSQSFFGLSFIVLGVVLFQRYGFLRFRFPWKIAGIVLWATFWIFLANWMDHAEGLSNSFTTTLFVFAGLGILYIVYEEEIRDLLLANRTKDVALAEQAAEIARLEPLSVLGERVAHVVHSFKNNLNQVSTALFLLEQVNDPARAAEKMREFSQTLNERIENILMVSRAGVDLEPELFDAARVLEGMKQVYLQEKSFVEKCRTVLTVEGPVLVHAVRWDFILMVENILKNALEAIATCHYYGTIRIDLARGLLTIANDGGPIPLCADCHDDCLRCPRYGKPGQTTKKNGSGHGLAQVFATCRANGWGLKLRAQENWTLFEIRFPGRSSAPDRDHNPKVS